MFPAVELRMTRELTTVPFSTIFGTMKSFILVAAYLMHLVAANQSQKPPPPAPSPVPSWARNRIFSISSRGLMSHFFSRRPTAKRDLISLVDHFKKQERRMSVLHREAASGQSNEFKLCNRVQAEVVESVYAKTLTLGFGVFRSRCITAIPAPSPAALFHTISGYGRAVAEAGTYAMGQTGLNWPKAYPHYQFRYNHTLFRCSVVQAAGFRIRGEWASMASVTEYGVKMYKSDPGRRYLVEFLRPPARPEGPVGNFRLRLPSCRSGVNATDVRNRACDTRSKVPRTIIPDTTTSLEEWRGIPAASIFRQVMPYSENPAVRSALGNARDWEQQALDSTSASNIAIMVLSATLTLVPLAAFEDVSLLATVVYAMFTDVLSCMPLAVKGVELIALSKRKQTAAESWIYGMETEKDIGIVETWAAECIPINSMYTAGLLFLFAALAAICIGIGLEIAVRSRLLLRNKRKKDVELESSSDDAVSKQLWVSAVDCEECECYNEKKS